MQQQQQMLQRKRSQWRRKRAVARHRLLFWQLGAVLGSGGEGHIVAAIVCVTTCTCALLLYLAGHSHCLSVCALRKRAAYSCVPENTLSAACVLLWRDCFALFA